MHIINLIHACKVIAIALHNAVNEVGMPSAFHGYGSAPQYTMRHTSNISGTIFKDRRILQVISSKRRVL